MLSATKPPTFSLSVLFTLVAVLAGSGGVFHLLTRRWTRNRSRAAIEEWAERRKFAVAWNAKTQRPALLQRLGGVCLGILRRGDDRFVKIVAADGNAWHVLIRPAGHQLPAAGLRPVNAARSVMDGLDWPAYPSVSSDRLIVHADSAKAARWMEGRTFSSALPPGIGLMLIDNQVVIDFSARPFDAVEFERMLVVMDTLMRQITAVGSNS